MPVVAAGLIVAVSCVPSSSGRVSLTIVFGMTAFGSVEIVACAFYFGTLRNEVVRAWQAVPRPRRKVGVQH